MKNPKSLSFKTTTPFEKIHHFVSTPSYQSVEQKMVVKPQSILKKAPLKNLVKSPPVVDKPPNEHEKNQYMYFDLEIDRFFEDVYDTSLYEAIVNMCQSHYAADDVVIWANIDSLSGLYSDKIKTFSTYDASIAGQVYQSGAVFFSQNIGNIENYVNYAESHHFNKNSSIISFPLRDFRAKTLYIVQICFFNNKMVFDDSSKMFIEMFMRKYHVFSRWIDNVSVSEPYILEMMSLQAIDNIIPYLSTRIKSFFRFKHFEIWSYDRVRKKMCRYFNNCIIEIDPASSGVVGHCLEKEIYLNCQSIKDNEYFNPSIDADYESLPHIIIPTSEYRTQMIFSTVIRGPIDSPVFCYSNEEIMKKITPFLALSLSNALDVSKIKTDLERSSYEREGLAALLEVAEILSGQLNSDRLTEIIMEKGRYLTKADRCSLFLVSPNGEYLTTSFHRGLKTRIEIPINKGVVGKTVTEAKALNITDAYQEPSFDPSTDLETGYRTRTILSVPIFNNRGAIIGVTEMINKAGNKEFSKWDTNLIQIFNVFCGISLENARLYNESQDMSSQLKSFFAVSLSINQTEDIKRLMHTLIRNARHALGARRAALFIYDEDNSLLQSYIVDGGQFEASFPVNQGIIGSCVTSKEGIVCNDPYKDPRFNPNADQTSGFKTSNICAVPILSASNQVLGVVEVINKINSDFFEKDVKLLKSLAAFASLVFENSRLKQNNSSFIDNELNKYFSEDEKAKKMIPVKLKLDQTQFKLAGSLEFFPFDWKEIELFKLHFHIFNHHRILETLNTSNEILFKFLYDIRQTYNDVPYHNWIHCCDVTQYLSFLISEFSLEKVFSPLEIAALIIASICHDANHEGFSNMCNAKTETPLSILYEDQSVMESHHCSVAIQVITKDDNNLFKNLPQTELKAIWSLIIKTILATDMANHFKIIASTTEKLDNNTFSFANPNDRLNALQILLKTADISNVSRPFQIAEKWCNILYEEFSKNDNNTTTTNNRERFAKPLTQVGFYNFFCIPLFRILTKLFKGSNKCLQTVECNLEKWKALLN